MLSETGPNTGRQGGLEDGDQENTYRGDVRLLEPSSVHRRSVQTGEEDKVSNS
jgi:hypothetical protein